MRIGRFCITAFNWAYLTLIVILLGVVLEPQEFGDPDWGLIATIVGVSYPILFFVLFILLTVTVKTLIKKLQVKSETLGATDDEMSDNFFKKEIKTLSTILIIFSSSYLLRIVYDVCAVMPYRLAFFPQFMINLLVTIPFDLIPLLVVIVFHWRNLSRMDQCQADAIGLYESTLLSHGCGDGFENNLRSSIFNYSPTNDVHDNNENENTSNIVALRKQQSSVASGSHNSQLVK